MDVIKHEFPKKKVRLIGHAWGYDIYETLDEEKNYLYKGTKKTHFKNKKYWFGLTNLPNHT